MRTDLRHHARRLRRFWRRPAAERSLRLQALAILVAVGAALRVLPFARVRRLLAPRPTAAPPRPPRRAREEVIDAVQAAARDVPGSNCLTQALALRFLLARQGYPAEIRVSVTRQTGGALRAHAWVQSGDLIAPCGAADLSGRSDPGVLDFDV